MLGVLQALVSHWKGKGEKGVITTQDTHPSTNPAEQGLTLLSRQDMVLSLWYSGSTLNVFFLSNRRKGNKHRKKSPILAQKIKNKKMRELRMKWTQNAIMNWLLENRAHKSLEKYS